MAAEYILLFALILLQYGDVWSTWRVIGRGGRELNPLVAWLIARLGLMPGLLALKVPICLGAIGATAAGMMPWWLLAGLCALYVGAGEADAVGDAALI